MHHTVLLRKPPKTAWLSVASARRPRRPGTTSCASGTAQDPRRAAGFDRARYRAKWNARSRDASGVMRETLEIEVDPVVPPIGDLLAETERPLDDEG